ncbi:MAG: OmpA family protein [Bacteroidales bacterium]|nr:OmpA family protein [Bacteroidales bacterium]
MKTLVLLFFLCLPFLFLKAQIKIDIKEKIEREAERRANDYVDEAIDKGFDKAEEGVEEAVTRTGEDEEDQEENEELKPDKNSKSPKKTKDAEVQADTEESKASAGQKQPSLVWAKYDFMPGEQILFEDNQENEQNGEFPSRWDLAEGGSVENAEFDQMNVIYFKDASSCIAPFVKNPDKDYLPDVFTLEFDAWYEKDEYCSYEVYFYDKKNQSESTVDLSPIVIYPNQVKIYNAGGGYYPGTSDNEITQGFWRHIAMSFNIRALKIYLDDARVLNIPNLSVNPEGISICCDGMNTAGTQGINRLIKNVRLAEGGAKLYDKLLQDGKIVSSGIKFDVNKATLKPESMGVINAIFKLMQEHPELNFSVEGHTDSDGDDASNQVLSEHRAKAVVDKLVTMGIDAARFASKGWGETKPLASNATSEGKASNRRVEFVKM